MYLLINNLWQTKMHFAESASVWSWPLWIPKIADVAVGEVGCVSVRWLAGLKPHTEFVRQPLVAGLISGVGKQEVSHDHETTFHTFHLPPCW